MKTILLLILGIFFSILDICIYGTIMFSCYVGGVVLLDFVFKYFPNITYPNLVKWVIVLGVVGIGVRLIDYLYKSGKSMVSVKFTRTETKTEEV